MNFGGELVGSTSELVTVRGVISVIIDEVSGRVDMGIRVRVRSALTLWAFLVPLMVFGSQGNG